MQISISNAIKGQVSSGGGSSFENLYSFEFDGSTDFIETTSTYSELNGQNNFTFSFWIKPTNLNSSKVVFSIGNSASDYRAQQFYCYIATNGQIFFYLNSMSYYGRSNAGAISINNWNHVLICRDANAAINSKVKIFVNAIDVSNAESTRFWTNTTNATTPLYIGEHTNGYLNPFLGKIDELAIWSGTDLRNDVATIYNGGVPNDLNSNGLTAPTTWYRMGDGATWTGREWNPIPDVQGSNDAISDTLPEAARTTDVPT